MKHGGGTRSLPVRTHRRRLRSDGPVARVLRFEIEHILSGSTRMGPVRSDRALGAGSQRFGPSEPNPADCSPALSVVSENLNGNLPCRYRSRASGSLGEGGM